MIFKKAACSIDGKQQLVLDLELICKPMNLGIVVLFYVVIL